MNTAEPTCPGCGQARDDEGDPLDANDCCGVICDDCGTEIARVGTADEAAPDRCADLYGACWCAWCTGEIGGDDPVPDPMRPTFIVAGTPLCTAHAVQEVLDIMRNPGTFVHSWPSPRIAATEDGMRWSHGENWDSAVPFYFEIRSLAI